MLAETWKIDTAEVIYQTNEYDGSDADVGTTQLFSDDIDLTQWTGATIVIKQLASGATDDLTLKVFKRMDDDWDGDEVEIVSAITVAADGTEDIYVYTIHPDNTVMGPGHYRLGFTSGGSTDTFDIEATLYRWTKAEGVLP